MALCAALSRFMRPRQTFMQNTPPSKAQEHWHGPAWALPALLALLSMLGPFAIDTSIPAFSAIAQSLGTDAISMQQTLSAYLLGFAIMNLFHGALADSFGRRPVVLWTIAVFTLASVGCAFSQEMRRSSKTAGAAAGPLGQGGRLIGRRQRLRPAQMAVPPDRCLGCNVAARRGAAGVPGRSGRFCPMCPKAARPRAPELRRRP